MQQRMPGLTRWVARATSVWWLGMGAVLLASGLLPQREYTCNDVFFGEISRSSALCAAPPARWVPDGFPVGYRADDALGMAAICFALALLSVLVASPVGRRFASRPVLRPLVRIAAVPFAVVGVASVSIGALERTSGLSLFGLGLLGAALTLISATRAVSRLEEETGSRDHARSG